MNDAVETKGAIVGIDLAGALVSNPSRAIAFYRDMLGMVPTEIDDQGRGAEFTLADGSTFAVWDGSMLGKTSGIAPMLAVDDITSAVARFRQNGAQLSEIMESGVCWMAMGEDPDGNSFIIHQRKAER